MGKLIKQTKIFLYRFASSYPVTVFVLIYNPAIVLFTSIYFYLSNNSVVKKKLKKTIVTLPSVIFLPPSAQGQSHMFPRQHHTFHLRQQETTNISELLQDSQRHLAFL